ncbi:MAG: hypothetical protein WCP20_01325 [Desulfuromonadales bacterium]
MDSKTEDAELIGNPETMTLNVIENMKKKASEDLSAVLHNLEKTHAGITEGLATTLGAGTGAAGSLVALSSLGTVSGLSAAGVTTGLAAAGGLLGGGMLVGIGILATPVAALGALSYGLARKAQKSRKKAAIGLAAKNICDIQARLIEHKEHFCEELAQIRTTLEILTSLKSA